MYLLEGYFSRGMFIVVQFENHQLIGPEGDQSCRIQPLHLTQIGIVDRIKRVAPYPRRPMTSSFSTNNFQSFYFFFFLKITDIQFEAVNFAWVRHDQQTIGSIQIDGVNGTGEFNFPAAHRRWNDSLAQKSQLERF